MSLHKISAQTYSASFADVMIRVRILDSYQKRTFWTNLRNATCQRRLSPMHSKNDLLPVIVLQRTPAPYRCGEVRRSKWTSLIVAIYHAESNSTPAQHLLPDLRRSSRARDLP